jgi:Flp pilus assembly protein TadD
VKVCDETLAAAQAEQQASLAALKARGISQPAEKERPPSWLTAAHLKGDALVELKDVAGAIKAYDLYLSVSPVDADILVARGLLKAQSGDKSGAETDFRQALRFIPDYQAALDALKQIGADPR